MSDVIYPTIDELVELNRRVLGEIRVKKADRHQVLSPSGLEHLMRLVEEQAGDVYEKSVTLLTVLVRTHPFASGNRRTAYLATMSFLTMNRRTATVQHDPRILQGIREEFYTRDEIKAWLKGHEIKEFRRE
jgi:prophage maintenance system killer protein